MSEWLDNQKKENISFLKLLKERIEKANLRRQLTAQKAKLLCKLEAIADKLKREENVQNRQLQTWLSEDEYEQLEYEFKTSKKEIMEISSGEMHVLLPNSKDWNIFKENTSFEIPAISSFKVKIKKITNYCCSYID